MTAPQEHGPEGAGWTPGPWKIDRSYPNNLPFGISTGPDGVRVLVSRAFAGPTTLRAEANARLIAAAPDLYAALKQAQAALQAAADQFAFYADEHAKKGTPEATAKGATNMTWARKLARVDHNALAALARADAQVRS